MPYQGPRLRCFSGTLKTSVAFFSAFLLRAVIGVSIVLPRETARLPLLRAREEEEEEAEAAAGERTEEAENCVCQLVSA